MTGVTVRTGSQKGLEVGRVSRMGEKECIEEEDIAYAVHGVLGAIVPHDHHARNMRLVRNAAKT